MQPDRSPSGRSPIRVALVEDDVNFQEALISAITTAPDMTLPYMASTRAQALQMLQEEQADVLVVDLGLPDGSGIDVVRAAHAQWPACDIMVSTAFGDEPHVIQSLEAGACGYLLKDSGPEDLLHEIRSLHAGGSPISPLIARKLLTRFRQADQASMPAAQRCDATGRHAALSARETEVLELIAKGFLSNEIAHLMSVSQHTVLTYVRRIYAKLEVTTRTEAVFEARSQGLLPK